MVSGKAVTPKSLPPADLQSLLLDADEVNSLMDAVGDLELVESGDGPDDTVDASPSACHGVIYISGETEYGNTDFTEMRWEAVASNNGSVVQSVAKFPSSSDASSFVEDQAEAWESCRKATITAVDKENGTKTRYQVQSISSQNDTVSAVTVVSDTQWQCQHVLQAVSSYVFEVSACASDINHEAEVIAKAMAAKIGSG